MAFCNVGFAVGIKCMAENGAIWLFVINLKISEINLYKLLKSIKSDMLV